MGGSSLIEKLQLLEEQAAQVLPLPAIVRVYQSEIANSQRIIENLTEQRAQILAEDPKPVAVKKLYLVLDQINRPDFAILTNRSGRAQERLEFSRNALSPHERRSVLKLGQELARGQQAESELNAQAVSFYKTAESQDS